MCWEKLILLSILVTSCSSPTINTSMNSPATNIVEQQPKTIRNSRCLDTPKIKVTKALNDGVRAYLCPVAYPSYYNDAFDACSAKGDKVYMPVKSSENDYVDDQKVTLPSDKCFVEDGTYTYIDKEEKMFADALKKNYKDKLGVEIPAFDSTKRIRKIKIIESQVPNPAYDVGKK